MKRYLISVLLLVVLTAGVFQNGDKDKELSINNLKSNLEYLASDKLEGRYTGSTGANMAAQFIASELKKYGVKTFENNSNYFQDFPLNSNTLTQASTLTLVYNQDDKVKSEILNISKEFSAWGAFMPGSLDTLKNYELVFVGYGISAPEYKYDDYAGEDVKGKVVVILSGEPYSDDPNYFNGKAPTQYSNILSKCFFAASKGVAGVIWLVPDMMMFSVDRLNMQSFDEALGFPGNINVHSEFALPPIINLYPEGAKKLFENEKSEYDKIQTITKSNAEIDRFEFNKRIKLSLSRNVHGLTGRNVIGLIEGSDPKLKNEFVTISAHYDHLGIKNGQVFNGADDNGSGVVAVLEIMRNLAREKKNARSIIAIFYTGEEEGLLGSAYFVQKFNNPEKIVANLNIDMCGREEIDDIFCVGPDLCSTDLNKIIQEQNQKLTQFKINYSNSNYEYINRSDVVPYYSRNIPVADFNDDMKMDYHRPSDDVDKIKFEKIYRTLTLVKSIAVEIANRKNKLNFSGSN